MYKILIFPWFKKSFLLGMKKVKLVFMKQLQGITLKNEYNMKNLENVIPVDGNRSSYYSAISILASLCKIPGNRMFLLSILNSQYLISSVCKV